MNSIAKDSVLLYEKFLSNKTHHLSLKIDFKNTYSVLASIVFRKKITIVYRPNWTAKRPIRVPFSLWISFYTLLSYKFIN